MEAATRLHARTEFDAAAMEANTDALVLPSTATEDLEAELDTNVVVLACVAAEALVLATGKGCLLLPATLHDLRLIACCPLPCHVPLF
jgi:hypothetical protein